MGKPDMKEHEYCNKNFISRWFLVLWQDVRHSLLTYLPRLTNCESLNVNSFEQSEGVYIFWFTKLHSSILWTKNRDGGRSENLGWRVVIRCFWSAKIWGGGERSYPPAPSGFAIPERYSNFAFHSSSTRCCKRNGERGTEKKWEGIWDKKRELKGQWRRH